MKTIFLTLASSLLFLASIAQNKEIPLELVPNRDVILTKNLSDGHFLKDVAHLSQAPSNCFSKTNTNHFNGKHVIFKGKVPPYCDVRITITSKQKDKNISAYAYFTDNKDKSIQKCQSNYRAKTKTAADILFLNNLKTGANEKTLFVGVTGSNKLSYADFTIKIYLKSS